MSRKQLMLVVLAMVTGLIAVLVKSRQVALVTEPIAQSGQSGGPNYPPGIDELQRSMRESRESGVVYEATAMAMVTPDPAPLVAIHAPSDYPLMITTAAQAESIVRGLLRNIIPTQLEVRLVEKSRILEILADDELFLGDPAVFNDSPIWLVAFLAPGLRRQSIGLEGLESVNQDAIDGVWIGLEAGGGLEAGRGIVVSPSARDWPYFVALPSEALPIQTPTPWQEPPTPTSTAGSGAGP